MIKFSFSKINNIQQKDTKIYRNIWGYIETYRDIFYDLYLTLYDTQDTLWHIERTLINNHNDRGTQINWFGNGFTQ